MILELLFVILLIVAISVVAYRGAVHEFQILQKDYGNQIDWSSHLAEQLPLIVRNLPKHWLGPWTAQQTSHKSWVVFVKDGNGKKYRTSWTNWLQSSPENLPPQPVNKHDLANVARLQYTLENWTAENFRRWSWIPVSVPKPFVFRSHEVEGIRKTTAEFTAIVSTDGEPLELWLAHEGAVPSSVANDLIQNDPWIQTTATIPWIGEVKFIEIRLRPGNAILVPKHWYIAIRNTGTQHAWFWTGEFHTPISRFASWIHDKS